VKVTETRRAKKEKIKDKRYGLMRSRSLKKSLTIYLPELILPAGKKGSQAPREGNAKEGENKGYGVVEEENGKNNCKD
jgi:hypothetical protein